MTSMAPSFAPGSDAGLSNEAQYLYYERIKDFMASPSVDTRRRAEVMRTVEEAAERATVPDWDGEGAMPVEQTTVSYASRFLWLLPRGVPSPSVLVDRDGDIVFDWGPHPRKTFSVSVARDGSLVYAGLFGLATTRGRENLLEGLSAAMLFYIERAAP